MTNETRRCAWCRDIVMAGQDVCGCDADKEIRRLRDACAQAEAAMTIVEPRNSKAKYLGVLCVLRRALAEGE